MAAASPSLSPAELTRYSRHLLLSEIGLAGQQKLAAARVLIIGAGGLGSPAALYLAAAGVGTLGIADFDRVEAHNLQRQLLHDDASIGRPKVASAAARLRQTNPFIRVVEHDEGITAANALNIFAAYDIIVDGTDTFPTRYLNNDAATLAGRPLVYGSIYKFEGQVTVFDPRHGAPCYRCLFPEPPSAGMVPNCGEAGVIGALCGVIGSLQALEAIKLITGIGEPLVGRLLHIDGAAMKFRDFTLRRDPECARCAEGRDHLPIEAEGDFCEASAVMTDDEISVLELAEVRQADGDHVLLDVREPWEVAVARVEPCLTIPMGEVAERTEEIPRDVPVYVLCHGGVRSGRVVEFLRGQGFGNVANVRGGIAAGSAEVDASVPVY
jgi:adenylyltransferase/sulfurtransferase